MTMMNFFAAITYDQQIKNKRIVPEPSSMQVIFFLLMISSNQSQKAILQVK
jgi:hypothetical protein